jgi:hypothetical protein
MRALYQLAALSLNEGKMEDAKYYMMLGRTLDNQGKYKTQYEWMTLFINEQEKAPTTERPANERIVLVKNACNGQKGALSQVEGDPDHVLQDLTEQSEHYVIDFYDMFGCQQLLNAESDGDVNLLFWQAKLLLGLCYTGGLTNKQVIDWINDHHTQIDSGRVRSKVKEINELFEKVGIRNVRIRFDQSEKRYKWYGPPFAVLTRLGHLI